MDLHPTGEDLFVGTPDLGYPVCYSDLSEARSIEKRYFTSDLSKRS